MKPRAILPLGLAWCASQFCLPEPVLAQCPSAPRAGLVANPNRPTVADPADITELGVLELEYGWNHIWHGGATRGNGLEGLVKFAPLCDLEVRWEFDSLVAEAGQRGIGDNWIGPQFRFHRQTRRVPTLSARYMLKIPTASAAKGLGSGRVDHQLVVLASKDLFGNHFDFNASAFWIGRPFASGYDRNAELNISFSRTLRGKLGITGELYGDTRLGGSTPGFVSTLWALTYNLSPRWVADAGLDVAVTPNAPHRKRFVMGFVYSLAELYPRLRR